MYTDELTGETWRFDVSPHDGTITRGRAYRLPYEWTTDAWRDYWDGDSMVCFIDGGYRHGTYAVTENEETERAITAYRNNAVDGLERLAPRLPSMEGSTDGRFILIHLDRGTDCYALSWSGDADNSWRDEIEAVYHGEIYRIEVEEWDGDSWQPAEEVCQEYYGTAQIEAGFAREFPLEDVPEQILVTSSN